MTTHFLPATKIRLCFKEGQLWFKMDGQKMALASPRRALPLSNPDEYILLRDADGNEVGVVRRIDELEPKSRLNLRRALAKAYRVTRIERVLQVERDPISGQIQWRVEICSDEEFESESEIVTESSSSLAPDSARGRFHLLWRNGDEGVETTGTQIEFYIAGAEDVQTARYPHIYIHDTDGNRYEILNCEQLDIESRRAAERYF